MSKKTNRTRLPKGMTMAQLRKLRAEDAKKRLDYTRYDHGKIRLPCGACGAMPPCRHSRYEGPEGPLRSPS